MADLKEWHRRVALDIAQAHPVAPVRASGNHLAAHDEPEPSRFSEQELIEADLINDQGKAQRRARENDAKAMELQVQHLRNVGGL